MHSIRDLPIHPSSFLIQNSLNTDNQVYHDRPRLYVQSRRPTDLICCHILQPASKPQSLIPPFRMAGHVSLIKEPLKNSHHRRGTPQLCQIQDAHNRLASSLSTSLAYLAVHLRLEDGNPAFGLDLTLVLYRSVFSVVGLSTQVLVFFLLHNHHVCYRYR